MGAVLKREARTNKQLQHLAHTLGNDELDYAKRVRIWCEALPDPVLRSMAEDYRKGFRDVATCDAWGEYQRRFPNAMKVLKAKRSGEGPARCLLHLRGRRPMGCVDCNELEGKAAWETPNRPSTSTPPNDLQRVGEAITDPRRELLDALNARLIG